MRSIETLQPIIQQVRRELKDNSDDAVRQSSLRFFKEKIKLYGVKTAVVTQIAKTRFKDIEHLDKREIFELCDTLWTSGYLEESFIACNWAYALRKSYQPTDFKIFETWVNDNVSNWASCDTLCNHTIAAFVEQFPDTLKTLKRWALSDNRWTRRASAVTLIIPARNGMFLDDIFEIADILLTDADDLVQKGYGWMLKAASEAHPDDVFNYVMRNKAVMPRTALRYAIEKMSKDKRAQAMAK
ncbi:MAG: DNA alkylation repair protein [Planctomycetota bacterium]